MKKQLNEIKRMQLLAGLITESQLNEKTGGENSNMLQKVFDKYCEITLELQSEFLIHLDNKLKDKNRQNDFDDYEGQKINTQQSIDRVKSMSQKNISSMENLAAGIKEIDDYLTNEISGMYPGDFYIEAVITPLAQIAQEQNISDDFMRELINILDRLYDIEGEDGEDTFEDEYLPLR